MPATERMPPLRRASLRLGFCTTTPGQQNRTKGSEGGSKAAWRTPPPQLQDHPPPTVHGPVQHPPASCPESPGLGTRQTQSKSPLCSSGLASGPRYSPPCAGDTRCSLCPRCRRDAQRAANLGQRFCEHEPPAPSHLLTHSCGLPSNTLCLHSLLFTPPHPRSPRTWGPATCPNRPPGRPAAHAPSHPRCSSTRACCQPHTKSTEAGLRTRDAHLGTCPPQAWNPVLDLRENPLPTFPSVPRLEFDLKMPRQRSS